MISDEVYEALVAALKDDKGLVSRQVPMSELTTFKIGGPAAIVVEPRTLDGIIAVVKFCKQTQTPMRVLGLGSDLLVSDDGLNCVILRIAKNYSSIEVSGDSVIAKAGASNKDVAEIACENGLSGYEFASGIPGTVGGAAIMNAGAYDGEFKDVCSSLQCVTPNGELVQLNAEEADWGYRHSMMDEAGYVVVSATLTLKKDSPEAIRLRIDDLSERRRSKQPLEMPSAGSTFKRPEGYFAGKLIQDAGLRGYRVGGAQVSTKHTGFVVNAGGATAADVRSLIAHIQKCVYENEGVHMHPEVRYWSDEDASLN